MKDTNRREFLAIAGASSLCLTSAAKAAAPNVTAEKKQKTLGKANPPQKAQAKKIILIMTDQQRWDMLNCYRQTGLKTPNLDQLASEGMKFETAYTCQPVCSPARSALFTGVFPHTAGVWSNCMPLGANIKTVGQRLRDKGYHCGYIGKWHLDGTDYFGDGVCPDGWDDEYWYDHRRYLNELSAKDRTRSRQFKTSDDPNLKADMTYGHRCADKAIDFLSKHNNDDFLLVVSFDEPHAPNVCPQPYSDMYDDYEFPKSKNVYDDMEEKPAHQKLWAEKLLKKSKDKLKIKKTHYFGCNSFIDSEIGRVKKAIDKYADDALVIYTSDHGDMMYSHSMTGKGAAMYEEITHIPLIVRWKNKIQPGTVCKHPVSHVDITPTILSIAGLDTPPFLQGKSLMPCLKNPEKRVNDAVFMEWGRYQLGTDGRGALQPIRAACDGRYKLVINLHHTDELYDIKVDPDEMNNLIDSDLYADIRNKLHSKIIDWMRETQDPFRGSCWVTRQWNNEKPSWDNGGDSRKRPRDGYEPNPINYSTGLEIKQS